MKEWSIIFYLILNTWTDIRRKEISLISVIAFTVAGIGYRIFYQKLEWVILLAMLPGMLMLLLGILTNGAVGLGDGIVLCSLGLWLEFSMLALIVWLALVLAAVYSAVLMFGLHKKKKSEIPFIPFILWGYIGGLLIWKGL